jgi:N-methylhydantoinase A
VAVEIPRDLLQARHVAGIKQRFDEVHSVRYGYHSAAESAEIVSLRVSVVGRMPKPVSARLARAATADAGQAQSETRAVHFGVLGGRLDTPVFDRAKLLAGHAVQGPALVEEHASTTVLTPADRLEVDDYGNLHIEVGL